MELFKIVLIVALAWTTSPTEGSYFEAGNLFEASPFLQQQPIRRYGYGFQIPLTSYGSRNINHPHRTNNNEPKQVPAVVPVAPTYQVEVMKAMAQLEEKKTVTLYIVPQNSLEVFPHAQQKITENLQLPPLFNKYPGTLQLTNPIITTSPNHIPAVEVPLEKPLVIDSARAEVLAPAGFTVLINGPRGHPLAYPFTTGVLLAAVPVGTIISANTPVVLTTLYAVPSLPALPSAVKILANFVADPSKGSKGTNEIVGHPVPIIAPRPVAFGPVAVGHYPVAVPVSPSRDQGLIALPGPSPVPVQVGDSSNGVKDVAGINVPASPSPPPPRQQQSTGFINSKESPFLLQLREESLKRQIKELQDELANLQTSPI